MSIAGVNSKRLWRVMYVSILLLISVVLSSCGSTALAGAAATNTSAAPETGPITVKITNTNPEVKTAIARVLETRETDTLDQNKLAFSACLNGQHISVWASGYYIYTILCNGNSPTEYPIALEAINATDNSNYPWIGADSRFNPVLNCEKCHSDSSSGFNEYNEWNIDGHSRAFGSSYFWTTYMGMNINGNLGQETNWSILGNGKRIRLPRDPTKPYYGPGYYLDFPNENGNCVFCHAPADLSTTAQGADLSSLIYGSFGNRVNAATEGVTCDVCHKVIDVSLGQDKLPYAERPGILSFSFVRPISSSQFAIGPRPEQATQDADTKHTCSPVFSKSEFCAACHYGKFSGVEIYSSYKEWLNSLYNQSGQNFRSCQDCHMPSPEPVGNTLPSERSACSETNLKFGDFNHNMMKYGLDPDNVSRTIPLMVKDAATVNIDEIQISGGQINFRVTVINSGAGHKFPTDSPLRHLILFVQVTDMFNNPLTQVGGPMIPKVGDSDYAGYPGQIYANLLKDKDTNSVPTIAYWNPVEPAGTPSDTRLVPGVPVQSGYSFIAPSNGSVTISVRLIYRNVFFDIANQKGLMPIDVEAAAAKTQVEMP